MSSDANIGILRERIDQAVRQVLFTDVFRNDVSSTTIKQLYKDNRRFPITSPDAISIPEPYLTRLVSELEMPH